jgi:hypothetical protein
LAARFICTRRGGHSCGALAGGCTVIQPKRFEVIEI